VIWIVVAVGIYLSIGAGIRVKMYAGPEDDGGLWAVLLWPLIVMAILLEYRGSSWPKFRKK
jgi:hypothetical protein